MDKNNYKKPNRRYAHTSKEEILLILEEYQACKAHTSIMDFCFDRKIPRSRFYYWRKTYLEKKTLYPKGRFIELSSASVFAIPSSEKKLFASIHFNGVEVQLHEYVKASYLQELLSQTSRS